MKNGDYDLDGNERLVAKSRVILTAIIFEVTMSGVIFLAIEFDITVMFSCIIVLFLKITGTIFGNIIVF